MSLKRKISDGSIEDQLSSFEEHELGLLTSGVQINDPKIIHLHKKQLELYQTLYQPNQTPSDPTLYQLRLHSRNYLHDSTVRLNYLNQIVNYHKPKRSTFTFNNSSTTTTNNSNNTNNESNESTTMLTREQLRDLRLRHFNKSTFGKKLIHYYTKYKHKTRHEALIKLRKFFTKTIKTHEF